MATAKSSQFLCSNYILIACFALYWIYGLNVRNCTANSTIKPLTAFNQTLTPNRRLKIKINSLASSLRSYRVYHRYIGLVIGIFVLISSITGILLGWKKDVDLLQPPVVKGETTDLNQWVSMAELAKAAYTGLDSAQNITDNPIDRLEARPEKGMVKVLFSKGYWEVQLDGSTGRVLSVARRHSDWIEQIHDGSIISDMFKLVSMNVLGLGLLVLSVTGFTLWFYPRRIRSLKSK